MAEASQPVQVVCGPYTAIVEEYVVFIKARQLVTQVLPTGSVAVRVSRGHRAVTPTRTRNSAEEADEYSDAVDAPTRLAPLALPVALLRLWLRHAEAAEDGDEEQEQGESGGDEPYAGPSLDSDAAWVAVQPALEYASATYGAVHAVNWLQWEETRALHDAEQRQQRRAGLAPPRGVAGRSSGGGASCMLVRVVLLWLHQGCMYRITPQQLLDVEARARAAAAKAAKAAAARAHRAATLAAAPPPPTPPAVRPPTPTSSLFTVHMALEYPPGSLWPQRVPVPIVEPLLTRQELVELVRATANIRRHHPLRVAYRVWPQATPPSSAPPSASGRRPHPHRPASTDSSATSAAHARVTAAPTTGGPPLRPLESDAAMANFIRDVLAFGAAAVQIVAVRSGRAPVEAPAGVVRRYDACGPVPAVNGRVTSSISAVSSHSGGGSPENGPPRAQRPPPAPVVHATRAGAAMLAAALHRNGDGNDLYEVAGDALSVATASSTAASAEPAHDSYTVEPLPIERDDDETEEEEEEAEDFIADAAPTGSGAPAGGDGDGSAASTYTVETERVGDEEEVEQGEDEVDGARSEEAAHDRADDHGDAAAALSAVDDDDGTAARPASLPPRSTHSHTHGPPSPSDEDEADAVVDAAAGAEALADGEADADAVVDAVLDAVAEAAAEAVAEVDADVEACEAEVGASGEADAELDHCTDAEVSGHAEADPEVHDHPGVDAEAEADTSGAAADAEAELEVDGGAEADGGTDADSAAVDAAADAGVDNSSDAQSEGGIAVEADAHAQMQPETGAGVAEGNAEADGCAEAVGGSGADHDAAVGASGEDGDADAAAVAEAAEFDAASPDAIAGEVERDGDHSDIAGVQLLLESDAALQTPSQQGSSVSPRTPAKESGLRRGVSEEDVFAETWRDADDRVLKHGLPHTAPATLTSARTHALVPPAAAEERAPQPPASPPPPLRADRNFARPTPAEGEQEDAQGKRPSPLTKAPSAAYMEKLVMEERWSAPAASAQPGAAVATPPPTPHAVRALNGRTPSDAAQQNQQQLQRTTVSSCASLATPDRASMVFVRYEVDPTVVYVSGPVTPAVLQQLQEVIFQRCCAHLCPDLDAPRPRFHAVQGRSARTSPSLGGTPPANGTADDDVASDRVSAQDQSTSAESATPLDYMLPLYQYTFTSVEEAALERCIPEILAVYQGLELLPPKEAEEWLRATPNVVSLEP